MAGYVTINDKANIARFVRPVLTQNMQFRQCVPMCCPCSWMNIFFCSYCPIFMCTGARRTATALRQRFQAYIAIIRIGENRTPSPAERSLWLRHGTRRQNFCSSFLLGQIFTHAEVRNPSACVTQWCLVKLMWTDPPLVKKSRRVSTLPSALVCDVRCIPFPMVALGTRPNFF